MFKYYLFLALKNARRAPALTTLIVVTLGLGIAACTIIFTVIHLMSADPIPEKSGQLYRVQLDNWNLDEPAIQPNEPPDQVTWNDSLNIVYAQKAHRQAAMAISWELIASTEVQPFNVLIRTNHADMFEMFNMPFLYGNGWSRQADQENHYVAVLSKQTNEKLFNGENSVGQTVIIKNRAFTVVGVLDNWRLSTKFYDLVYGPYYDLEDVYLPFTMRGELELPRGGWINCPDPIEGDGYSAFLSSECVNYQLWVELINDTEKQAFQNYLNAYVDEQRALGRFPRPTQNRLLNVKEWLIYKKVVSSDLRVVLWLSFMFLVICIINASSLITTKLNGMKNEAGLRRALGASRAQIFTQYLIETLLIGFLGGFIGLLLALAGLQGIKSMYQDYQHLVQPDLIVVVSALSLAIFSAVLSGLIPILKSFSVTPAIQLKQG